MGCDFYKGTFLTIIYVDASGIQQEKIIQLGKESGYFGNSFDRDFMTTDDYFTELRTHYTDKDLYVDGNWVCLEPEKYKKYADALEGLQTFVRVYKSVDFWER